MYYSSCSSIYGQDVDTILVWVTQYQTSVRGMVYGYVHLDMWQQYWLMDTYICPTGLVVPAIAMLQHQYYRVSQVWREVHMYTRRWICMRIPTTAWYRYLYIHSYAMMHVGILWESSVYYTHKQWTPVCMPPRGHTEHCMCQRYRGTQQMCICIVASGYDILRRMGPWQLWWQLHGPGCMCMCTCRWYTEWYGEMYLLVGRCTSPITWCTRWHGQVVPMVVGTTYLQPYSVLSIVVLCGPPLGVTTCHHLIWLRVQDLCYPASVYLPASRYHDADVWTTQQWCHAIQYGWRRHQYVVIGGMMVVRGRQPTQTTWIPILYLYIYPSIRKPRAPGSRVS